MNLHSLLRTIFLIPVLAFLGLTLSSCTPKGESKSSKTESDVDYYTCSMHPSVHLHNPDDKCPICSMDLIPVKKKEAMKASSSPSSDNSISPAKDEVDYYTCPMHPSVHLHDPKAKCPICGMDLVPVKKKGSEATELTPSSQEEVNQASIIEISPQRLQAIGVTSATVHKQRMERVLRAPATVSINQSARRDINIKTAGGYIEKLYANYEGKFVKKGDPLMSVLSEGWIDAQMDYIRAYRAVKRLPSMTSNYNSFEIENKVDQLRKRIRIWDLSEEQIQKLEAFALTMSEFDLRTGKGLSGTFNVLAPFSGHVHELKAVEGMHFDAGESLLMLVDLSQVWIEAAFPEDQVAYIAQDQAVQVTFPSLPGRVELGVIDFVHPHFDEMSRRLMARITLPNPNHKLRPGMYANVESKIEGDEKIAVASTAVIPTGDHFVVFLDHGKGKIEPRYVDLGSKFGDYYEVISGLNEGDQVITSANFLIDSESRIQGALKSWSDEKSSLNHSSSAVPLKP